jgi:hypothetical protein
VFAIQSGNDSLMVLSDTTQHPALFALRMAILGILVEIQALVAPSFHLLLCGPPGDWHPSQLTALRPRYPDTQTTEEGETTLDAPLAAYRVEDGEVLPAR